MVVVVVVLVVVVIGVIIVVTDDGNVTVLAVSAIKITVWYPRVVG